jgi:hypothetical protein
MIAMTDVATALAIIRVGDSADDRLQAAQHRRVPLARAAGVAGPATGWSSLLDHVLCTRSASSAQRGPTQRGGRFAKAHARTASGTRPSSPLTPTAPWTVGGHLSWPTP